jgi:hypothetical protein
MINYTFEKYKLNIEDKDDNTSIVKLEILEGDGFALTDEERRKVYIVHSEKEVLYVGEAHTSMKIRMQRGYTAFNYLKRNNKRRNGYGGYKWLDRKENPERTLILSVATFGKEYDGDEHRKIIEAIEGELVYLVREEKGLWPKFQNEIHFHNDEEAKKAAMSILKKAFEGRLISHAK